MKAKQYLETQLAGMWHLQEASLSAITDEIVMRVPSGTVSPIGVIWLHFLGSQDYYLEFLTGTPKIWKSEGWDKRFGVEETPGFGADWSTYHQLKIPVELLREYDQALHAFTQRVLDSTDDNTLDEPVQFFTDHDTKADIWALYVDHTIHHCGEISALKGVFGGKGLPF
ncbi:MAG: DinB family protein [Anaerolineaceae bacterium]|nr:DinB family protein [Anaerolineaceae bacterium]